MSMLLNPHLRSTRNSNKTQGLIKPTTTTRVTIETTPKADSHPKIPQSSTVTFAAQEKDTQQSSVHSSRREKSSKRRSRMHLDPQNQSATQEDNPSTPPPLHTIICRLTTAYPRNNHHNTTQPSQTAINLTTTTIALTVPSILTITRTVPTFSLTPSPTHQPHLSRKINTQLCHHHLHHQFNPPPPTASKNRTSQLSHPDHN